MEVDGEILRRNVAAMAAATGGRVIPVVKANAYGHGLVNTARALGGLQGALPFGVGTPTRRWSFARTGSPIRFRDGLRGS